MLCVCSSADRATVSGTVWRGFDSLQMREHPVFQKPGVFWILRAHKNKRSALNACEITKNMIYFYMDTLSVVLQPPYKEEPHLQVKHNEQEK